VSTGSFANDLDLIHMLIINKLLLLIMLHLMKLCNDRFANNPDLLGSRHV